MKWQWLLLGIPSSVVLSLGMAVAACGQDAEPGNGDVMWTPGRGGQGGGPRSGQEGRRQGVFGKISAIAADSIEITGPDGDKVALKIAGTTEFRKDRQPAKISDYKVGDVVFVRTDQPDPKGATAVMVASGQGFGRGQGGGGQGGPGGPGGVLGTLGKDYVVGEVKSVDPPKLTVMRTDNVAQSLELNEETSLHRGRDSITMADIQVGDHVFARGAVQNNVFVPKNLNVIPPEMWKRMQEMNSQGGAPGPATPNTHPSPNAPAAPPSPKSPPEPQN